MAKLAVVFLLTLFMVVWLIITDDGRATKKQRGIRNSYREHYKYGELAKRQALGRGKLVALTPDNIQAFSDRYNRTDIFYSALGYSSPNERLYESLRWGDLYFSFEISENDLNTDKGSTTAAVMLANARKLIKVFEKDFFFPITVFRMFFTGNGFDILISATAMCVEPQMELCQIYEYIAREIADEYDIKYLNTDIYRFRSLLRVVGTLNSDTSVQVSRYKIELTYKEFMTLSFKEMDLLSRKPRQLVASNEYYNRVEHAACIFYDEVKRKYNSVYGQPASAGKKPASLLRPCIQRIFEGSVGEKYQQEAARAIAQEFRRLGSQQAVVLERLGEWNRKNRPILSDSELEEISDEIFSGFDEEIMACDDSVLLMWCTGQDKCSFYHEFQAHKSKMLQHSETLFEAYKWPLRLGVPQTALYRAIVAFESKRGVSPGDSFVVSVDELASYIGSSKHHLIIRYLMVLKRFGLIKDYGLRDNSTNIWIRRVIPIPDSQKSEWA
jgi:hypothetical protein